MEQRAINGQFLPGNRDGFQPEQSGNPAGRPKHSVTTLLKNTDKKTTKKIADKLTELAEEGDLKAIDMFIDRTDGKVTETHAILGAIQIEVVYESKQG